MLRGYCFKKSKSSPSVEVTLDPKCSVLWIYFNKVKSSELNNCVLVKYLLFTALVGVTAAPPSSPYTPLSWRHKTWPEGVTSAIQLYIRVGGRGGEMSVWGNYLPTYLYWHVLAVHQSNIPPPPLVRLGGCGGGFGFLTHNQPASTHPTRRVYMFTQHLPSSLGPCVKYHSIISFHCNLVASSSLASFIYSRFIMY